MKIEWSKKVAWLIRAIYTAAEIGAEGQMKIYDKDILVSVLMYRDGGVVKPDIEINGKPATLHQLYLLQ